MLDWMFILIFAFAFLFMLFGIFIDDKFWKNVFILTDIVLWFFLAASVMEIEIPYQFYNATSGNLETGYQIFTGKIGATLPYFFVMFASIMIVYWVKVLYQDTIGKATTYKQRFKRR
jgi:hypothetical protein